MYRPELLEELIWLVTIGFVDMQTSKCGRFMVFKYTEKCNEENGWETYPNTRTARGIVFDGDGNIIARPLDKFFNFCERPETNLTALPMNTTGYAFEKFDGSCVFSYIDGDTVRLATFGSFESEQAQRAQKILHHKYPELINYILNDPAITWIFEVIYPENHIVVDYGDTEDIVLLAQRYLTGTEVHPSSVSHTAERLGLRYPKVLSVTRDDLQHMIHEPNTEGWVIWFDGGLRVKIKSDDYVQSHRLLPFITPKRIIKLMMGTAVDWKGEPISYQEVYANLNPMLRKDMDDITSNIRQRIAFKDDAILKAYSQVKDKPRKMAAKWLKNNVDALSMAGAFAKLDGKTYRNAVCDSVMDDIKRERKAAIAAGIAEYEA